MKKLLFTILLGLTVTAHAVTIIPTSQGGTGTSTKPTLGQVLVGLANGTYRPQATSTLGLGGGGGSGTVTSVSVTTPTGLTASTSTCTTACLIALALQSGYIIPLTASTTNWNNFYNYGTSSFVTLTYGSTTYGLLKENNTWTALNTFASTTYLGIANFINATFNNSTSSRAVINTDLDLNGTLSDKTNTVGTYGQFLMSTSTGVLWTSTSSMGFLSGTTTGTGGFVRQYGATNTSPIFDTYTDFVGQVSNPTSPSAGIIRLHSLTANGFTRLEQDNEATTNVVLGRDGVIIAKNTSGATLAKGTVVRVTGSTGNVPNISLAGATTTNYLPAVAIVVDSINNNAFGQVMVSGIISGFDTSAFTTGDRVYLATSTMGGLTATRPTVPNYIQRIGTVLVSGVGNGSLLVNIAPAIQGMETGTNATLWSASSTFVNNSSTTNLTLYGLLFDSTNASGTAGQILKSNGTSTGWVSTSTLFGTYLTAVTGTYPIIVTGGNAISTGFSTSTVNSYSAQQTFVNASATAMTIPTLYFTNASGTGLTATNLYGNVYPTGLSNGWAAFDVAGKLVATTTFPAATLSGGALGYVTRWLSATTLGTSTVLDDGLNAGVNATSSLYEFYVKGDLVGSHLPFGVASTSGEVIFSTNFTDKIGVGTTTGLSRFTIQGTSSQPTTNIFTVASSSGAVWLNILPSGLIGIATTSTTYFANQPATVFIDNTGKTTQEGLNTVTDVNDFFEVNVINKSNGANAQACATVSNASSSATTGYLSVCANSPKFNNPQIYNTGGAFDTSIQSLTDGDLIINNATGTKSIKFVTGNASSTTNTRMNINQNGSISIATSSTVFGVNIATTTNISSPTSMSSTTSFTGTANNFNVSSTTVATIGTLYATSSVTLATTTVTNLTLNGYLKNRVVGYASNASTTVNCDTTDIATTTISASTTIVNFSGTAYDGQMVELILMSTTSKQLWFGTVFGSSTDLSLPNSIASGTMQVLFQYDAFRAKWWLLGLLKSFNN